MIFIPCCVVYFSAGTKMYINNNKICVNVLLNFPNVINSKRTINQSNMHTFAIYTSWRGCEPAKGKNFGTLRKCSFVTRQNREEGNSSTNFAVQDRKNTFQLHSSIITFSSSLLAHVNLWNVKCERKFHVRVPLWPQEFCYWKDFNCFYSKISHYHTSQNVMVTNSKWQSGIVE